MPGLRLGRCGQRSIAPQRSGFVGAEALHFEAEGALEVEDFGALVAGEEGGGNAVLPCSAGAADSVDEIFGDFWEIVVDDVGDVLDVDAAGGQVGGDQDADAARLKIGQGGGALGLRAVTVNHGGGDAVAVQGLGDAVGETLGAGEDQAAAGFFGRASE